MEQVDVVIIGAGWHGLAAAKAYLECHTSVRLLILDDASTIGGVWAQHRLYEGLKTNNLFGTYEFREFPMDSKTYGVKPGQYISGEAVHRYLEDYANHFDLRQRTHLNCSVDTIQRRDDGTWLLTVTGTQAGHKIMTAKLIMATGLTSQPHLPKVEGQELFDAPIIHVKDMAKFPSSKFDSSSSRIVVFGGTKSAWDAVYLYASSGVSVDWAIRESGRGPAWMAPAYVTPLRVRLAQLPHIRLLTWFSPCIWGEADGFTWIR